MNLRFRYFWPLFNKKINIFTKILDLSFEEFSKYSNSRIEIHSVFVKPRRFYSMYIQVQIKIRCLLRLIFKRRIIYIWYTGELINPPNGYDLTLSFLPTSRNNIYWPLWASYIDYNNDATISDRGTAIPMEALLKPRSLNTIGDRQWKACAFISNAVDWRFELARNLESLGLLDIYGNSVNKPVSSKRQVSSKYMFQLCFENTVQDNYITEKPIEAWFDGNIPIYTGSADYKYLNPMALIDCHRTPINEMCLFIENQMSDHAAMLTKWQQPILSHAYDYQIFLTFLKKAFVERFEK
jgi:hypothetical protein